MSKLVIMLVGRPGPGADIEPVEELWSVDKNKENPWDRADEMLEYFHEKLGYNFGNLEITEESEPNNGYCERCNVSLKFQATLGAPGKGSDFICPQCGKVYWTPDKKTFIPADEVDPEDLTLDPGDVI